MHKIGKFLILAFVLILLVVTGAVFLRFKSNSSVDPLPVARPYTAPFVLQEQNSMSPAAPEAALPDEVNLQVPFTSQAPDQNWSLPYQQFCEEASALMAASYIQNQPISSPKDADTKLLAIKDFEMKKFGFYEDTTAQETAVILREYFNLSKVEVVADPAVIDIKTALAQGKVAIVPLAGRQLGNPYFQQPGPLYHMLVIKGYKKNGDLITNDPGTKRGADYIYKTETIMNAIHDWNNGNVETGKKVMLVVG